MCVASPRRACESPLRAQVRDEQEQPRASTRFYCRVEADTWRQTYLVGGQLKGDSTPEGYIRALQQGCRCVERTSVPSDRSILMGSSGRMGR